MKKYLTICLASILAFDCFGAWRNYFQDDSYDERYETPFLHGLDYKNKIGTREYPWDLSFQDWFESPYLMPMRRYLLEERGIVPTATYLGNFAANPVGGRSQGAAMASNVNMDLTIDLGKLSQEKILEGVSFATAWSWRFGDNLSRDRIGNNFTVQQVYGSPVLRCQSMFMGYHKAIDDWEIHIKLGRFAAGDNFLTKPIYWLYQNNAFDGNPVGIFKQQKWSAYPAGTWAAFARIDHKNGQYFKAGVYKINSEKQDSAHEHGLDWSFKGEGVNANFELGWDINHDDSGKSPANISIGIATDWYNVPYVYSDAIATDFSYTLYLQADCMIWNLGNPKKDYSRGRYIPRENDSYRDLRGLVLWGAIQFNPNEDTAEMPLFINGGLLFNAPFKERADDVICFGVAYGKFSDKLAGYRRNSYELATEINYKFQVNRFFFLQPNLQYIIHTNGGEYPDALVIGLQFGLNL